MVGVYWLEMDSFFQRSWNHRPEEKRDVRKQQPKNSGDITIITKQLLVYMGGSENKDTPKSSKSLDNFSIETHGFAVPAF